MPENRENKKPIHVLEHDGAERNARLSRQHITFFDHFVVPLISRTAFYKLRDHYIHKKHLL